MLWRQEGCRAVRRAAVLGALCCAAAPAAGQSIAEASVALNSQYQARGLTTTNRRVIQAELQLALPWRLGPSAAGVWLSAEGGKYDRAGTHLSENGGAGVGVAEWNVWIEREVTVGRVTGTGGALGYLFPNRRGTTPESNTLELYVGAAMDLPLSPSFTVWHDVHAVDGVYGELSIRQAMGGAQFDATAGYNFSQSVGDGGPFGYYGQRGLSHVEFAVATDWSWRTAVLSPSAHLVVACDRFTRVSSPNGMAPVKLWFGVNLSWRKPSVPWSRSSALLASAPAPAADSAQTMRSASNR